MSIVKFIKNKISEMHEEGVPEWEYKENRRRIFIKIIIPKVLIKSSFIGTFHKVNKEKKKPAVMEGDILEKDEVVCFVESLRQFSKVKIPEKGKIVKFLVSEGQKIQYGTPILLYLPIKEIETTENKTSSNELTMPTGQKAVTGTLHSDITAINQQIEEIHKKLEEN